MDLVLDVAGLDTIITRYTNAPPGGAVELWTINNGPQRPGAICGVFTPSDRLAPRASQTVRAAPVLHLGTGAYVTRILDLTFVCGARNANRGAGQSVAL